MLAEGHFDQAASHVAPLFARTGDPTHGFLLLSAQCSVPDFAAAKLTLDALAGRARSPEEIALLARVRSCASAEWMRHARLKNPALAGRRKDFRLPPPHMLLYTRAAAEHAARSYPAALATIEELKRARPAASGVARTMRGKEIRFDDFVDADDLVGGTFPVYHEGEVHDLAISDLKRLVFLPRKDAFHEIWPEVTFETLHGERGNVCIPRAYAGSGASPDPQVRLGQVTTFDHDLGYAIALGLRDFWVHGTDGSKKMMGLTSFERIDFMRLDE